MAFKHEMVSHQRLDNFVPATVSVFHCKIRICSNQFPAIWEIIGNTKWFAFTRWIIIFLGILSFVVVLVEPVVRGSV